MNGSERKMNGHEKKMEGNERKMNGNERKMNGKWMEINGKWMEMKGKWMEMNGKALQRRPWAIGWGRKQLQQTKFPNGKDYASVEGILVVVVVVVVVVSFSFLSVWSCLVPVCFSGQGSRTFFKLKIENLVTPKILAYFIARGFYCILEQWRTLLRTGLLMRFEHYIYL